MKTIEPMNSHNYETEDGQQPKKIYVKNSELYAELVKWRDSNSDPEKRIPSEALGEMMLKIATRYMNHPNYIRYPQSVKEDIIGKSCIAMLTGLNSYKFEYKNPFAYFTQICWSCAMDYLAKYYRHINFRRELMKKNIEDQVAQGINIKSGEKFLRMLNDLTPLNEPDEKVKEDNQKFISELLGSEVTLTTDDDASRIDNE